MPNILFTWELGAGNGHSMQMAPLARALVKRGHNVFVALRDPAEAETAFAGSDVHYVAAPHYNGAGRAPAFPVTHNFAHVLGNCGWSDDHKLFALMCCWANLYAQVKPDVGVFDHSPTALLASRGLPMRRVVIGSGFCVPPDESPWPLLREEFKGKVDLDRVAQDEQRLLDRANRLLGHWGKKPLGRLAELYAQADETFLTTLPELEQCPSRRDGTYWGPVLPDGGEAPQWPETPGRRAFAYLKRFDGLSGLAATLAASGRPTILYVEGLSEAERKRLEGPSLHVTTRRQDLRRAAAECDAAVLHAGQGATAAVLLAGKPILQIPLVLEQRLTADASARLGAALVVNDRAKDPAAAGRMLDQLLTDDRHTTAARRFARKYADFDPEAQVRRMVERVEELVEKGRGGEDQKGRHGDKGTRGQGAAARHAVFAG